MKAESSEPLKSEAGALNCAIGEVKVGGFEDASTNGGATARAIARLTRDIGQALLAMAVTEGHGTLEFQLTRDQIADRVDGSTTHRWKVDVWKARQRQYLRVPVRKLKALQMPGDAVPKDAPPNLAVACTHCGHQMPVPGGTILPLPRKSVLNCTRCTLPLYLLLVDQDAGKKP